MAAARLATHILSLIRSWVASRGTAVSSLFMPAVYTKQHYPTSISSHVPVPRILQLAKSISAVTGITSKSRSTSSLIGTAKLYGRSLSLKCP